MIFDTSFKLKKVDFSNGALKNQRKLLSFDISGVDITNLVIYQVVMSEVVKIVILNCPGGKDWGPIYTSYLETYIIPTRFSFEYTVIDISDTARTNKLLDNNEYDGYVITGSTCNAYDNDEWIVNLIDRIRIINETNKKLLGICFGHQIISRALGGVVSRSEKGWGIGHRSIDLTKDGQEYLRDLELMYASMLSQPEDSMSCRPLEDAIILNYSHQDQVVDLPLDVLRVAGSNAHCPHAVLYRSSPMSAASPTQGAAEILTFQGHPEFSSALMLDIITMLREHGAYVRPCPLTGAQVSSLGYEESLEEVVEAVAALAQDTQKERHTLHSSAIGKCIIAFLCSKSC